MKLSLRTVALRVFVFALIAAGLFTYPAIAEDSGTDFWSVLDLHDRMAQAQEESRWADREELAVMRRIAVRNEVIRELLEGRITFEEASERFAELNRHHAAAMGYVRRAYSGRTDEERAAWQLASHLRGFGDPAAKALGEKWECILASRQ